MQLSSDSDAEKLELSGNALAALQDFYKERDNQQQRFEELKGAAERTNPDFRWSMQMFAEDWNASQFWYSDDTAKALANQLLTGAHTNTNIAVISAPSVFVQLKNLIAGNATDATPQICLLEYDERFNVIPEFVHYDFHQPLKLDPAMKGIYDRILCDPPFLSPECQAGVAMTVRWLAKPTSKVSEELNSKIIICTGERMEDLMHKLYPGINAMPIMIAICGHVESQQMTGC